MNKAELHKQIEEMTEEEAVEVKLIYAPAWPDEVIPIEEIRRGDAELPGGVDWDYGCRNTSS